MSFWKTFLTNRKHKKSAEEFGEALGKQLKYRKDVLKDEALKHLSGFHQDLHSALKERNFGDLPGLLNKGERLVEKYLPFDSLDWLREQVEVILVAVVVALAIRTYFYQPFKIPTDSMKPTLYGVQSVPLEKEPPNWIEQRLEQLILGRLYHSVKLQSPAQLVSMEESTWPVLKIWFDYTDLTFSNGETHRVWCSPRDLGEQHVYDPRELKAHGLDLQNFTPEDPRLNFVTEAGDQVLVNKWLFNFRLPQRGEVLVFRTTNIEGIESDLRAAGIEGSEFYIKRCVGLPGDTLSVNSPLLLINGSTKLENAAIRRVESAKDGYRGYGFDAVGRSPSYLLTPNDTFTVPQDSFWAMGDNSYDSLDSRFWGVVPRENIVGTGTLVWWPFTKRWGWIH